MLGIFKITSIGIAIAAPILLLALVTPAFAYMDPNTGNLIFQILLPVITGVTTAWLFFKSKIRRLYCLIRESLKSAGSKSKKR
jgi:hypothetical protein